MSVDYQALQALGRDLLVALGENPDREGLRDTPRRWASWWQEFIDYDAGNTDTTFESVSVDQMVVVSGIPYYSLCEHHLLPFKGMASIGYITGDKVLGLSKFARIVQQAAHKLQLQERMAHEIADQVQTLTDCPDVAVLCRGEHLCMQMRGIKSPAIMSTSVMRGVFMDRPEARAEFLKILDGSRHGSA